MNKAARTSVLVAFAAVVVSAPGVLAKPPSAPVRVEYVAPPSVARGEPLTMTLTLRALADLDRLEVSVRGFDALEVLSSPRSAAFADVKKGEGREFQVTIRLVDERAGSLAVFFKTVRGAKREAGTTGIAFRSSSGF